MGAQTLCYADILDMTFPRVFRALAAAGLATAVLTVGGCTSPRNDDSVLDAAGSLEDARPTPPPDSSIGTAGPRPADAGTAAPDGPAADTNRPPDSAPPGPSSDAAAPPPGLDAPLLRPDAAPDPTPPEAPPTVAMAAARNAPARLPGGTKVICLGADGMPSDTCPVLRWNNYTYWALSYDDNRIELDIVAFNGNNVVVKEIAARGTRYIRRITVDPAGREVTFLGQDEGVPGFDPAVNISFDDLRVADR